MKLLADTNVFLAVILNEPTRDNIVQMTMGYDLLSPSVLPFEIGNALSAMVKRKKLSSQSAIEAIAVSETIPVRFVEPDIRTSLEIALQFNLYAYDAYFLQCALHMNIPLLTMDRKMSEVAKNLNIRLLEVLQ